MSQERTEKATPKKREDARKKGQIARGNELPTAFSFLAALFTLDFLSQIIFEELGNYIKSLSDKVLTITSINVADANVIFLEAVKVLAFVSIPIIAVSLSAGVLGNLIQTGFTLTPEALKPKPEKFNPVSNIKRVFGLDSVVNLSKSFVKLVFFGLVAYGVLAPMITNAPSLINAPIGTVAIKLGGTLYDLAFRYALLMVFLAFADYGYVKYKHEKSLRMTKQEIRDEYKQQEGDPLIKHLRRNAARNLVQKRSLAEVSSASVVITNPTHFAVALRYNREEDVAPLVVAKGADFLAKQIRELAAENNIPLVENQPLARALYKIVEPNQMVPVEFFGAVAEVLAYVYQKENSQKGN